MLTKTKKTVLALGADLKNRFLLARGEKLRFGPKIGDLGEARNFERFRKEIRKAVRKHKPDIIACDMHPAYFSSKVARESDLRPGFYNLRPVQHHHAHIASVLAEYNIKEPVIGVSFDGTGFGTDGRLWGGDFLMVKGRKFRRLAHFKYIKMPGGEKCVKEPWRMALAIAGKKAVPFLRGISAKEKELVLSMCEKSINSPLTSSVGRLFDAAAAILGVCRYASFEAEGPIKLEAICKSNIDETYSATISKRDGMYIIDPTSLFAGMMADLKKKKDKSVIAAKFHNSVANIIVKVTKKLSRENHIKIIALSGGVFQNKFLTAKVIEKLRRLKLSVFINNKTSVNDFNIALGQYYVSCGAGKN